MHTVLITGASGALGKAVVKCLARDNFFRIISTSRAKETNDYQFLDVSDKKQIQQLIEITKPRLIIHLAATFQNDYDNAYQINVASAKCILDSVEQLKLNTRVLLIGSAAEYGAVTPEENPIKENHALNPVSVYGLTKAWQSQLAKLYASNGVDVLVARVFNLEGFGLSDRLFIGRVNKQINAFLQGIQSVIETGPLNATRDYITIEEAVEQTIAIAKHGKAGNVYHVASGVPVVMRDLLYKLLSNHQISVSVVRESTGFSNRSGYDVPVIFADIENTNYLMSLQGRGVFEA